jgi:DNA-binding XRE family transcriptional regulator
MSPEPAATLSIRSTLSRVQAWIRARRASGATNEGLAGEAGVDEKTIRQAQRDDWNPRVETARQLEALIPDGWMPGHPVPPDLQAVQSEGRAA